ncbi:MAG: diguanylate cyclase [Deltaproteobacteria bacterium]|nr:diguanylate cyclase [Deltaproteobacteria bacterium]
MSADRPFNGKYSVRFEPRASKPLPLHERGSNAGAVESAEASAEKPHGFRVLMVISQENNYHTVRDLFHQSADLAFEIERALDLETATTLIEKEKFDAILIEEKIESDSGLDWIREVTARDLQTNCVLVCEKGSSELEDAAITAGASDLLEISGLNPATLFRAVRFGAERKKSAQHLIYLAQRDCLTGLSNRMLFEDRLQHAIKRASRSKQRIGLLYIDLDGFKAINDTRGHAIGDKLLKVAAQRMVDSVREVDMVARLGGDEFVVILESLVNHEDGIIVANRIVDALQAPFFLDRQDVKISASIGIAVFPEDATDDKKLILSADRAMYLAKAHGGNCAIFASEGKNAKVANRFALEFRMEHALNNGELYINYQPQVDLHQKRVLGTQGFSRWRKPTRGDIGSDDFFPLLEDSALASKVCLWMIEEVCKDAVAIRTRGIDDFIIEVAILKRFFLSDDLADSITNVLERTGMPAESLVIGLTEDMIRIERRAEKQIESLHRVGVQLSVRAIDTGASSIARLENHRINAIIIPEDLIRDAPLKKQAAASVKASVAIARELGIRVIAENNENELFLALLQNSGCNIVQSPIELLADNIKGLSTIKKRMIEKEMESQAELPAPVQMARRFRKAINRR